MINPEKIEIKKVELEEGNTEQMVAVSYYKKLFNEDGEVVNRQSYTQHYFKDSKERFLTEVEGAEAYIAALGW